MEGEKDHAGSNFITEPGLGSNPAPPADNLDLAPIPQLDSLRIYRVDLSVPPRFNPIQAFAAAGHRAGVVMIENPAGGQDQRIFPVWLLSRELDWYRKEAPPSPAEFPNVQNGRTRMVRRRTGPG